MFPCWSKPYIEATKKIYEYLDLKKIVLRLQNVDKIIDVLPPPQKQEIKNMSKPKLTMLKSRKSSVNSPKKKVNPNMLASEIPANKKSLYEMTETIQGVFTEKKEEEFLEFNKTGTVLNTAMETQFKKEEKESVGEDGGGAQKVLNFFK